MLVHPNICVDLPFIDGHKVLEALREKGIDVPTIFVSGLPGEEPEVRAFAIGAADFIRKPVKNRCSWPGSRRSCARAGTTGGGRCFAFADTRQSTTDHAVDRPRQAHNRSLWCMLRSPSPEALRPISVMTECSRVASGEG